MRHRFGGRQGRLMMLSLAIAVAGIAIIVVAFNIQRGSPPVPPEGAGGGLASSEANDEASGGDSASPKALVPSRPVSISIPAIDVDSEVFPIGKAEDGTLEVPQPGPNLDKAAWFDNSPTPGQLGPSVIEGHVETESGPSVFFELGDLRRGDRIEVAREDGSTAVFTVSDVRTFPKDEFPTRSVYGRDVAEPTLQLITCSNFDPDVGTHTDNLIVYSELA